MTNQRQILHILWYEFVIHEETTTTTRLSKTNRQWLLWSSLAMLPITASFGKVMPNIIGVQFVMCCAIVHYLKAMIIWRCFFTVKIR